MSWVTRRRQISKRRHGDMTEAESETVVGVMFISPLHDAHRPGAGTFEGVLAIYVS